MKLLKKIVLGTLCILLSLVVLAGGTVFLLWHNELFTLLSLKQLRQRDAERWDGGVYTMHVRGGYYLDDFIRQGGAKSDKELIDFATRKLTKGLVDMEILPMDLGCTSFTAKTEEGDALFCRNYDMTKATTCIVFTDANRGRHASVSTADLNFLGITSREDVDDFVDKVLCLAAVYVPLDGVNDAGVSCSIHVSSQGSYVNVSTDQNTEKPDLTSSMLIRMILDYADDLDEAVQIASSYDMHDSAGSSYLYMVADASGRSAVLEWVGETDFTDNDGSARVLKVTYSDADAHIGKDEAESDFQVATNFILQPGYYEGALPNAKDGVDRYSYLYGRLGATGGVVKDEKEAMQLLANVSADSRRRYVLQRGTVYSAVYNLTDKTVLWVPSEIYDDPEAYYTFTPD